MANDPFSADESQTFRLTPISLGALVGGVIAFVWSGAIAEVLWVVLGVATGAGLGLAIRALARRAKTLSATVHPQDPAGVAAQPAEAS